MTESGLKLGAISECISWKTCLSISFAMLSPACKHGVIRVQQLNVHSMQNPYFTKHAAHNYYYSSHFGSFCGSQNVVLEFLNQNDYITSVDQLLIQWGHRAGGQVVNLVQLLNQNGRQFRLHYVNGPTNTLGGHMYV